jgi:hypothetical protein
MSTWGLYPWSRENGTDLIHPDDLALVLTQCLFGNVCEVLGEEGPYLVLRFSSFQFRGRPVLFRPVPPPVFRPGQEVMTKAPRTLRKGVIRDIVWHFKRNEPVYLLAISGRGLNRRYFAWELEAI